MRLKRGLRLFGNKKGMDHELFFTIFDYILATVVIISLLAFVSDIAKKTIFEKNYLSRDTALLLNTLSSAPGEVSYTYIENMNMLNFQFLDGRATVSSQNQKEAPAWYPYAQNKHWGYSFTPSSAFDPWPNTLVFSKEKAHIGIKQTYHDHEHKDI